MFEVDLVEVLDKSLMLLMIFVSEQEKQIKHEGKRQHVVGNQIDIVPEILNINSCRSA